MSDTPNPNGRTDAPIPQGGILAALPRARPQRSSPRRTAARSKANKSATVASVDAAEAKRAEPATKTTAAGAAEARSEKTTRSRAAKAPSARSRPVEKGRVAVSTRVKPTVSVQQDKAKPTPTARKAKLAPSKPIEPPAPKQGYEPEEELELGTTVDPPSGTELAESLADIVSELARSGLAAGGRLLKDAFSVLRRP